MDRITLMSCAGVWIAAGPLVSLVSAEPPGAADVVSPLLFGVNLSYFNDLDSIWAEHDIAGKLRTAGIGVLRYPGGEETSRFHWEHPGVNGYVDLWDESMHGQRWMSTWVPPETWATNDAFMSFDEYIDACRRIGAEPLVGVNMSSGARLGRVEDSIDEAVRWVRYARDHGYHVRYWFLDNEPWHKLPANIYRFEPLEYAELCVRFSEAMKAVDPGIKLIANPTSGDTANRDALERFLRVAGHAVDGLDFHWYWEFGSAGWLRYASATPLRHSSRWQPYSENVPTYVELIRGIRKQLEEGGWGHVFVSALEWNVGPPAQSPMSPSEIALVQSEMLMQFIEGGMEMACMWPLFWQVRDPVVPARTDRAAYRADDRAILSYDPPHLPQPSYHTMAMLSAAGGGRRIAHAGFSMLNPDPALAVLHRDAGAGGKLQLFWLNKSDTERTRAVSPGTIAELVGRGVMPAGPAKLTIFQPTRDTAPAVAEVANGADGAMTVALPPRSLVRLDLPLRWPDTDADQ